jgi:hypothetical protein
VTAAPGLFVGGPWHGTVHNIDDRHHGAVNVPRPPPLPVDFLTGPDTPSLDHWDPGYVTYYRHRWVFTGGTTPLDLWTLSTDNRPDPDQAADALRRIFEKAAEGQTPI